MHVHERLRVVTRMQGAIMKLRRISVVTLKKPYVITRGKVIFDYTHIYCETPEKLLKSDLFLEIVERFIERIASRGSSLFAFLKEKSPSVERNRMAVVPYHRFPAALELQRGRDLCHEQGVRPGPV